MKRLFFSLYLAVTLGLLFINQGAELAWRQTQATNDQDIQQLAQLASLVELATLSPQQLNTIEQRTGIPAVLLNADSIYFMADQQQQLQAGKTIVNYDESDNLYLYRQQQQHLLQLGPIHTDSPTATPKTLFQFASYLFLAIVILFWSWPLWRDLARLKSQAKAYAKGNFERGANISRRSVVSPISLAFSSMAAQIANMIQEQKHMFNAVSHDLRTPLARLKFSSALIKDKDCQTAHEMDCDIAEIESLVDEILSYARLEAEKQLDITQVDLFDLLSHLVTKLSRNTDKTIQLQQADRYNLLCDGSLVERAIQNLVVNAIRHSQSQIQITVSDRQGCIAIDVEDDGPGIAEADLKDLFLPFTRLESSRNKASGGFGLGLAIVKRIADWHCGDCSAGKSKSLGGARFSLSLPINNKH